MQKKIRALIDQYAIPAAFIVFILLKIITLGLGKLLSLLPAILPMAYLYELIMILVPIGIVCFFGFSRAFKNGNFFKGILCGLPFVTIQLLSVVFFFTKTLGNPEANWRSWEMIVYGVISIIGVGIREECLYRATIQNIVAKKHANSVKGIWISLIVGSVIFGLTHATNIFFGMEKLAVLAQVISSTVIGLLFGAIYLRSGSLWAVVFIHTLTDISGLANSTFLKISEIVDLNQMSVTWSWFESKLLLWLIYVGFAAFLLRPSKCKEIIKNLTPTKAESQTDSNCPPQDTQ